MKISIERAPGAEYVMIDRDGEIKQAFEVPSIYKNTPHWEMEPNCFVSLDCFDMCQLETKGRLELHKDPHCIYCGGPGQTLLTTVECQTPGCIASGVEKVEPDAPSCDYMTYSDTIGCKDD